MNDQNDVERRRMLMQESIDTSKPKTLDELCEAITKEIKRIHSCWSLSSTLRWKLDDAIGKMLLEHEDILVRRGPE